MAAVLYSEPLVMMGPGAIARVCGRFGLTVIPVPRDRVGQTVGFLAGYQGFPERPDKEKPPEDRVLVFCEVDRETLDQVLEALKADGAPTSLKAILTGTNAGWPFARLARELSAEHRAMGGR